MKLRAGQKLKIWNEREKRTRRKGKDTINDGQSRINGKSNHTGFEPIAWHTKRSKHNFLVNRGHYWLYGILIWWFFGSKKSIPSIRRSVSGTIVCVCDVCRIRYGSVSARQSTLSIAMHYKPNWFKYPSCQIEETASHSKCHLTKRLHCRKIHKETRFIMRLFEFMAFIYF